ncbi:uncharacterized protein EpC_19480 [Erwinia pyrifoliae Ep1/96]|nr:uncharacterized protein EpC_19480 [Erwinia pyrifoliae Ep1/96]
MTHPASQFPFNADISCDYYLSCRLLFMTLNSANYILTSGINGNLFYFGIKGSIRSFCAKNRLKKSYL